MAQKATRTVAAGDGIGAEVWEYFSIKECPGQTAPLGLVLCSFLEVGQNLLTMKKIHPPPPVLIHFALVPPLFASVCVSVSVTLAPLGRVIVQMDPLPGMTALVKEENGLFLDSNDSSASNSQFSGLAGLPTKSNVSIGNKPNVVRKSGRQLKGTRAFPRELYSVAEMFRSPTTRGATVETTMYSANYMDSTTFELEEDRKQKAHRLDSMAMGSLEEEKQPRVDVSELLGSCPGVTTSRRSQLNAQEQHQLMADFNKQLCSLAPSIDVIMAENMDSGFPMTSSSVLFSTVERDPSPAFPVFKKEEIKPIVPKKKAPLGRSFLAKSNKEIEEVPQASAKEIQFKKTADGGLKPVFDDDDEESAMNEASLASTSSFEEFDREHGELFDEMIRPGEDPRMARIRFMAKMRARKFRAKATLQRKERLQQMGIITGPGMAGMMPAVPFTEPIEAEFKPAPLNNLATALVKSEEPIDLNLDVSLSPASAWPEEMEQEGEGFYPLGTQVLSEEQLQNMEEMKKKRAETQRLRRTMLSEERKEAVREQNRIRQKQFRERRKMEVELGFAPTPEILAYNQKKAEMAEKMRVKRAIQSEEQKALEREKNTAASRKRRQEETEEQRQARRQRDADAQRARRLAIYVSETDEQKAERKRIQAEKRRQFRALRRSQRGPDEADTSTGDEMSSSREVSLEGDGSLLPVEYPQE